MADNFGTLNDTSLDNQGDLYLLRQGGIDYRQTRERLAASIANARWSATANYEQHSTIIASDGVRYRAVQGSGVDRGGAVDPVSDTDNSHWVVDISEIHASFVGLIGEFHDSGPKAGWVELQGGVLSRTTDKLLWDYANAAGMVIAQATKDSDPMTHAMKFGDGDGSTTFTLPNHHLGHFVRGNPAGVTHGDTQGDAIREIQGYVGGGTVASGADLFRDMGGCFTGSELDAYGSIINVGATSAGIDRYSGLTFKASNVVPTADEIRPYTANLSIKIHRGWM